MVYGTYNKVTGANLNQRSHHNGGPHIASSQNRITGAKSSAFLCFFNVFGVSRGHVVTAKTRYMQWVRVILAIMGILITKDNKKVIPNGKVNPY